MKAWLDRIGARPATQRAYALGPKYRPEQAPAMDEEQRRILFGQTSASIASGAHTAKA